ncbi:hypothetical protein V7S57_13675 [Caulobacter sp. CCNWLY153]|uniref:hypothetical protein n=1 Tax=unclassified Caulobacter TaxID=2648921 RepID=UPI002FEFD357
MNEPSKPFTKDVVTDPELSGADLDAWLSRNEDALETLVAEADAQGGERSVLDVEKLIAEETSRFLQVQRKA